MFSFFKCKHKNRKLVPDTRTLVCQDCGFISAVPCEHAWNGVKDAPLMLQCSKCGDVKLVDTKGHSCIFETVGTTRIFGEDSTRPEAIKYTLRCRICGNMKYSTCSS